MSFVPNRNIGVLNLHHNVLVRCKGILAGLYVILLNFINLSIQSQPKVLCLLSTIMFTILAVRLARGVILLISLHLYKLTANHQILIHIDDRWVVRLCFSEPF